MTSRETKIGDYVDIYLDNKLIGRYIIISTDPNEIYITEESNPENVSKLININNEWKVFGDEDGNYVFEFGSGNFPTENPNIDIQILSLLDNKSLLSLCPINKYINLLCHSDELWITKIIKEIDEYAIKIKPKDQTYRNWYFLLIDPSKMITKMIKQANIFAGNGDIETLKWLEERDILPDVYGANLAAKNGHIKILNWLDRILPDNDGANLAVLYRQSEVLKWLAQKYIFPDIEIEEHEREWIDTLNLVMQRDILSEYDYQNTNMSISLSRGTHELKMQYLNFYERTGILINQDLINLIVKNGHIEALKFLFEQKGILPDVYGANFAVSRGFIEILEWLAEQNILPDTYGANYAALHGQIDALEWLAQRNIFPDTEGIDYAIKNEQTEVLKWLAERLPKKLA